MNYSFKDTISINVVYEVTKADGSAYVLSEWLALEAPKTSPATSKQRRARGVSLSFSNSRACPFRM